MTHQTTQADTPPDASPLLIWNAVCATDPRYTKTFSRSGGFSGTAINSTYLIREATRLWGAMGDRWGVTILDEDIMEGAPIFDADGKVIGAEKIHKLHIRLWYPSPSSPHTKAAVEHFGQTTFVGVNKRGIYTDEEAPKKSLTDAIGKALSMLGFSADVYLGLFDDSKYVNDRKADAEKESKTVKATAEPKLTAAELAAAKAQLDAAEDIATLRATYEALPAAARNALKEYALALSKTMVVANDAAA